MPRYLIKKRRRWYAVMEVPKQVRPKIGNKRRLMKSLKTESLTVAETRVHSVIANWKQQMAHLQNGNSNTDATTAIEVEAEKLRLKGWNEPDIYLYQRDVAEEFKDENLYEAVEVVHGQVLRLDRQVDHYLASLEVAPKTKDMQKFDLERFADKFTYTEEITKNRIADWVEVDLMRNANLSAATCRRIVSTCRGYWRYMERHHNLKIPAPFDGVVPAQRKKTQSNHNAKRKSFNVSDYQRLLHTSQDGQKALSDLIALAAYTGARIEEICSLKVDKVSIDRIEIEDTKTAAGWRSVPIHPHIVGTIKLLKETSEDGYLLSGLTFNKYGNRSNAIGKRFGRLKSNLGYGPEYVFHSFRKGFARQLESASVPENIAARLLGHEFKTMSYGVYSGGVDFGVLREALIKISWK